MSNNEQDLLEQILEETDGRKNRQTVSASKVTPSIQMAVSDPKQAKIPAQKEATEQVAHSAPVSSSGLQQMTPAQQAEAPVKQSESGGCTDQSKQSLLSQGKTKQQAVPRKGAGLQTAAAAFTHSDKIPAQDAPKKQKTKRKKFSYVDVLRDLFPWKGDSILEGTRKIVFLASVIAFSICLNIVVSYYKERHESKELYGEIQKEIGDITIPLPEESSMAEGSVTEYLTLSEIGKKLLAQNPDSVGYISIPGTKVNYPVVQRRAEDGNEYYLYRSFNLEDNEAGTVFLDYRNYLDVAENDIRAYANSTNLVIYGHNMEDGAMFGSLKYYKNDWSFYEKHPLIVLNSCYNTYTYKIFGYYIADGLDTTDTQFEYWNTLDFSSEEDFYNYVNDIKRRTLRNTNVDLQYGDQLITLSTCHGMFDSAKFVVVGRMVRPGEDPYAGTEDSELNNNVLWPTIYYRWNSGKRFDPEVFTPYTPVENGSSETTSEPEHTGEESERKEESTEDS